MIAEWFVTLECNYSCPYCYLPCRKYQIGGNSESVLKALKKKGFSEIDVLGGEPFLSEEVILATIDYCSNHNLRLRSISTNGSIYNRKIVERLKPMNGFVLQVSLDAATPFTYRRMRNSSHFNRVISNIHRFTEDGLDVFIGITLTRKNYQEIIPLVRLAEKMAVRGVSLGGFVPVGRGKELSDWVLSPNEVDWVFNLVKGLKTKISILGLGDNDCPAGITKWCVLPNGDLYPCGLLLDFEEARVGNIFQEGTFALETKWLKKFVAFQPPLECKTCSKPSVCYGGCKAALYDRYKDFRKHINPLCR